MENGQPMSLRDRLARADQARDDKVIRGLIADADKATFSEAVLQDAREANGPTCKECGHFVQFGHATECSKSELCLRPGAGNSDPSMLEFPAPPVEPVQHPLVWPEIAVVTAVVAAVCFIGTLAVMFWGALKW